MRPTPPPHRHRPARRTVLALFVLAGTVTAACGGSSGNQVATSDPGRTEATAAGVTVEQAASQGTAAGSGDVGSGSDNGSGPAMGGGAGNGSGGGSGVTVGQGCDTAGEGATAAASGGEAVCTRMTGDGKLIWAWPDGSIGATPGAAPAGDGSLAGILGAGDCDDSFTVDRYTAPIVDPALVSYIYPLGGMLGTHITPIDHVYVYFPEPPGVSAAPERYGITSPADGRVVAVEDFRRSNGYPYPDHRIVIEHSCSLYSVFIHVGELRGALADEFADGALNAPVPVAAGDLVADDSTQPGFDFSTFDADVQLDLADLDSYASFEQWKPYTADPLTYFPDDVRSAYEQLSLRVDAPLGGRIDWDLPGTARGVWFVQGTNGYRGLGDQAASYDNHGKVAHGYWDTHLAMAPDAVDPTAFVYSIGDWEGCPCQFLAVGNPDPASIAPSATPTVLELVEFSYANADGSMMDASRPTKGYRLVPGTQVVGLLAVQLHDDGSMTVEKLPGVTSAASFTAFGQGAQTYVR